MNKQLKTGLLLQIPNLILVLFLISYYICPIVYNFIKILNIKDILIIIIGSIYILINIVSLILIIVGGINKE